MPYSRHLLFVALAGLACTPGSATPDPSGEPETSSTTAPVGSTSSGTTGSPATSSSTTSPAADTTSTSTALTGTSDDGDDEPPPLLLDVTIPDAPKVPPKTPPWLVHLANVGGEIHLFQVDIDTAVATDVCTVVDTATMLPFGGGTPSVTFTRDDRMLFSTGSAIYEVELPSCLATQLGPIGFGGVYGICPDEGNDLYGLSSSSDALIRIDAQTGAGTLVGPLGSNWEMLGGTWNEVQQQILGINSVTDGLYEIDGVTGMASLLQVLPLDFMNVGVEFHPLTEQIYACTTNSHLYRLEMDGSLTDIGDMGFSSCTNLGAPWSEEVILPTPM